MKIKWGNQTRKLKVLNQEKLVEMVERAAGLAGLQAEDDQELNLVFISERAIRNINARYLGRNRLTDVIAFNLGSSPSLPEPAAGELEELANTIGEIYICPRVAARTAPRYQTTPETEVVLYIVHGLLHLAEYEDETAENQTEMRREEKRIMKILEQEFSIHSILRIGGT